MVISVNIIHPYVYKLVGETLTLGKIPQYEKRDEHISLFLQQSLNQASVLVHRGEHPNSFQGYMLDSSFKKDLTFRLLLDKRVQQIVTTQYGCPINDEKPSDIDDNQWKEITDYYSLQSELMNHIKDKDKFIFIGGALEACLANIMICFRDFCEKKDSLIVYIPDLCVSVDKEMANQRQSELQSKNICPISLEDALNLIKP